MKFADRLRLVIDQRGISCNEGGKYFCFAVWHNWLHWRLFVYIAVLVSVKRQRWLRWWCGMRKGAYVR